MKRLMVILLVAVGVGVAALMLISLTPTASGRVDDTALELAGTEAALFNTNHDCSFCHGVHGASASQLLQNASVEALCLSCHGPGGPATLKADIHIDDGSLRVTCQDCHDPHSDQINRLGNPNLKMVLADIVSPTTGTSRQVVFESRGTDVGEPTLFSFCDDDEDNNGVWDQVCDVCHDSGRHAWDGSGNHHRDGETCTRCHTHPGRFEP